MCRYWNSPMGHPTPTLHGGVNGVMRSASQKAEEEARVEGVRRKKAILAKVSFVAIVSGRVVD